MRDEWLDRFADQNAEVQEDWLDNAGLIHRQTKRAAGRRRDDDAKEQRAEAAQLDLREPGQ